MTFHSSYLFSALAQRVCTAAVVPSSPLHGSMGFRFQSLLEGMHVVDVNFRIQIAQPVYNPLIRSYRRPCLVTPALEGVAWVVDKAIATPSIHVRLLYVFPSSV